MAPRKLLRAAAVIAHQPSAAYGWITFETNMMHALGLDQVERAREEFLAYARSAIERELRAADR